MSIVSFGEDSMSMAFPRASSSPNTNPSIPIPGSTTSLGFVGFTNPALIRLSSSSVTQSHTPNLAGRGFAQFAAIGSGVSFSSDARQIDLSTGSHLVPISCSSHHQANDSRALVTPSSFDSRFTGQPLINQQSSILDLNTIPPVEVFRSHQTFPVTIPEEGSSSPPVLTSFNNPTHNRLHISSRTETHSTSLADHQAFARFPTGSGINFESDDPQIDPSTGINLDLALWDSINLSSAEEEIDDDSRTVTEEQFSHPTSHQIVSSRFESSHISSHLNQETNPLSFNRLDEVLSSFENLRVEISGEGLETFNSEDHSQVTPNSTMSTSEVVLSTGTLRGGELDENVDVSILSLPDSSPTLVRDDSREILDQQMESKPVDHMMVSSLPSSLGSRRSDLRTVYHSPITGSNPNDLDSERASPETGRPDKGKRKAEEDSDPDTNHPIASGSGSAPTSSMINQSMCASSMRQDQTFNNESSSSDPSSSSASSEPVSEVGRSMISSVQNQMKSAQWNGDHLELSNVEFSGEEIREKIQMILEHHRLSIMKKIAEMMGCVKSTRVAREEFQRLANECADELRVMELSLMEKIPFEEL